MRPVVCASCGTKNPRGSKYCNECGHELIPTSTQLCPNCEASNPIDRLYCDNCGTRLAAEEEPPHQEEEPQDDAPGAGSPEPFSLPARPPGQTGRLELDRELPAWLRTGEEDEGGKVEGGQGEGAQAPEEGGGEHRPADDLPDWLLDEDEASEIFRSDKSTDELFLASQEEGGGDGGDEEEEETERAGEASLPPQEGKAEEALSEWLSGTEEDAGDEDAYGQAAGEGLADWLEELEQEEDRPPAEEGLSDWLAELEDDDEEDGEESEGAEAEAEAAGESAGAWLADVEGDEAEQAAGEEESAGEGVADWLADLEKKEEVEEKEPDAPEFSDWLANLEEEADLGASASMDPGEDEPAADEGADEQPPWKSAPSGEVPEETGATVDRGGADEAPEEAEADVPDWLADLEEEVGAEAEPAAAGDDELLPWESGRNEEVAEEGMATETPDWLADFEEEVDAGTDEVESEGERLPWEPEAAEPDEPGTEEAAEESAETSDEEAASLGASGLVSQEGIEDAFEAGVPNWLADLEDKAESGAETVAGADEFLPWEPEAAGPTEAGSEADEADGESIVDGVPDWLADFEEEAGVEEGTAEEEAPATEGGAFSEQEAADWLARLHQETEEAEPADESGADAEAGEVPPEDLEGEIPAWLTHLDSEAIQTARGEEVAPEDAGAADDATEAEAEDIPDWLAAIDAEEEEAWAAGDEAPEPEVDELPDWLADVDAPASEKAATLGEAQQEEVLPEGMPDWLGDEEQTPPEDREESEWHEAPLPDETAPAGDEVPDWLQEMAPDAGVGEEQGDEELASILGGMDAGDEMADWLMEAKAPDEADLEIEAPGMEEAEGEEDRSGWSDAPAEEVSPAKEASIGEEAPAEWDEIDFEAAAEEATSEEEEVDLGEPFDLTVEMEDSDRVSDEDLPDWLGDVMADVDEEMPPAAEEVEGAAATDEPAPELENVPEQLASAELPEWLEDSLPEEAAPAEPTPLEEMPDWIQAAGQSFLGQTEEEVPAAGIEGDEEIDLDLETSGEWEELLEGLPPPGPTADEVREAEIPEWVQAMKPQELTGEGEERPAPRAPAETSGPLAGLRGVIGVEPPVTEPHSTSPMSPLTPSKEQERQAALLRQLTRGEESEAFVVASTPESAGSPWVRALLALLLLATVLVGLFVPGLLETTPNATGVPEAQEAVAAASGRPVLVAFDYTPATAAVLDGQASLLLDALAEGDSPVYFISQSPAGLALAQQAVDQVDGLESHRLGYLPGEAVGLRRLTACLEKGSACRPIMGVGEQEAAGMSAADLGLIIVLTADRDSLINWIEQVNARTTVPMVVGVTQALAPVAGPYLTSEQLDGLVAGFPATAAFQAEAGDVGNRTQAELEMLTLAQWLVVALFIVGNVLYLAFGSRHSRTGKGEAS